MAIWLSHRRSLLIPIRHIIKVQMQRKYYKGLRCLWAHLGFSTQLLIQCACISSAWLLVRILWARPQVAVISFRGIWSGSGEVGWASLLDIRRAAEGVSIYMPLPSQCLMHNTRKQHACILGKVMLSDTLIFIRVFLVHC